MVLVQYDKDSGEWIERDKSEFKGKTKPDDVIYLDGKLREKLDYAKAQIAKNWDVTIVIDGLEGSGKSNLGFAIATYMADGNLTLDNIAEGSEDAVNKLEKLPDGSVLDIDEGSLAFSSTDVMSKEQKRLTKILNVIRQKRMCLIITCPSFFNLAKYVGVERSRLLLHTYTRKGERGYFGYYGEKKKKKLYRIGKKNFNSYDYPSPNFRGRFTICEPFGEEYKALKKQSLFRAFHGDDKKKPETQKDYRKKMVLGIKERNPKMKQIEIANLLNLSVRQIGRYLNEAV